MSNTTKKKDTERSLHDFTVRIKLLGELEAETLGTIEYHKIAIQQASDRYKKHRETLVQELKSLIFSLEKDGFKLEDWQKIDWNKHLDIKFS